MEASVLVAPFTFRARSQCKTALSRAIARLAETAASLTAITRGSGEEEEEVWQATAAIAVYLRVAAGAREAMGATERIWIAVAAAAVRYFPEPLLHPAILVVLAERFAVAKEETAVLMAGMPRAQEEVAVGERLITVSWRTTEVQAITAAGAAAVKTTVEAEVLGAVVEEIAPMEGREDLAAAADMVMIRMGRANLSAALEVDLEAVAAQVWAARFSTTAGR